MNKLKILLLLFLSSFLESPAADPKIGDCMPVSCGDVKDISYPFWIRGKQPSFCGFPQFELHCDDDDNKTASLNTSNGEYIVRDIFPDNQSLLVTAADTNAACPLPYHNLTFNYTPFNVSSANRLLMFLSNCTLVPPGYGKVCTGDDMNIAFLAGDYMAWEAMANVCLPWAVPVLPYPADGSDYIKLVKNGFLLDWIVADCTDCKESHGECGYSLERNSFMCICSDQTHSRSCVRHSSFSTVSS